MLVENKTQNAILEASLQMMNESGYGSLSISEVARRAGISKQNLYYHYPNMEDIFKKLVELWSETGQQCTLEALADLNEVGAYRILGSAKGMFSWMSRYPDLSKLALCMFQSGHQNKEIHSFIRKSQKEGLARIESSIRIDERALWMNDKEIKTFAKDLHILLYGRFFYICALNDFSHLGQHEKECLGSLRSLIDSRLNKNSK